MIDNIYIAILLKVNELASRYGIKPYEFVATIHNRTDDDNLTLQYEIPVSGDQSKELRFNQMLDQVGIGDTNHALSGSDQQIIDALDNALHLAPKRRPRT